MQTKVTEDPTISPESGVARVTELEPWKTEDATGVTKGVEEVAGEPELLGVGVGEITVTWPVVNDIDADCVSYWSLLHVIVAATPDGADWKVLVYAYWPEL